MRDICLFVEDFAHHEFLSGLLGRLCSEYGIEVSCDWRNTRRGHGAVVKELKQFLRDLQQGSGTLPDLIVVATDANCKGFQERVAQIARITSKVSVPAIYAVPDPHIERWLLLDSSAFREVFGRGCNAPDLKCDRNRYKKMLIAAIHECGVKPSFGGIEFAKDIVMKMDLERAAKSDASLGRLLASLRTAFRDWQA